MCADPATRTAYIAITRVDKSMLKASPTDGLSSDTLQIDPNPCGVIMSLNLDQTFEATSAKVCAAGSVIVVWRLLTCCTQCSSGSFMSQ